ncbi:ANTAR domain-containing protein [Kutzneria sp. 744]|uniref:ANTAR domain-containing protein n=1 Tax=Kutzneria sp. (strain 744) TaxID=345341 RepID=UPI0005BE369A|nr:ANTAR domain-containing protein [Kutzneria sp. 744]
MQDHRLRLRALLAGDGNRASPALARICALAVSELAVTGVGVTLLDQPGALDARQQLARATDAVAAQLEDLQFTLGEGPGRESVITGAPVLVPDLAVAGTRWPAFTSGARTAGVAAVFSFPLQLGTIGLGSLDCYRMSAGSLSHQQVSNGLVLAELAFEAVLAAVTDHAPDDLGWISDIHVEVHQASGIVMHQQGINMREALMRIRAFAYAHELPLAVVAGRIVDRRLTLDADE